MAKRTTVFLFTLHQGEYEQPTFIVQNKALADRILAYLDSNPEPGTTYTSTGWAIVDDFDDWLEMHRMDLRGCHGDYGDPVEKG